MKNVKLLDIVTAHTIRSTPLSSNITKAIMLVGLKVDPFVPYVTRKRQLPQLTYKYTRSRIKWVNAVSIESNQAKTGGHPNNVPCPSFEPAPVPSSTTCVGGKPLPCHCPPRCHSMLPYPFLFHAPKLRWLFFFFVNKKEVKVQRCQGWV